MVLRIRMFSHVLKWFVQILQCLLLHAWMYGGVVVGIVIHIILDSLIGSRVTRIVPAGVRVSITNSLSGPPIVIVVAQSLSGHVAVDCHAASDPTLLCVALPLFCAGVFILCGVCATVFNLCCGASLSVVCSLCGVCVMVLLALRSLFVLVHYWIGWHPSFVVGCAGHRCWYVCSTIVCTVLCSSIRSSSLWVMCLSIRSLGYVFEHSLSGSCV
jgi:hypothetical protein